MTTATKTVARKEATRVPHDGITLLKADHEAVSRKKRPFLSDWLSSANLLAGSFRAPAIGQAGREVNSAVTEPTNETMRSSCAASAPTAEKKTPPRKR